MILSGLSATTLFALLTSGIPAQVASHPAWSDALMPLAARSGQLPHFCGGDGAAACPIPGDRTLWLLGDFRFAAASAGAKPPAAP